MTKRRMWYIETVKLGGRVRFAVMTPTGSVWTYKNSLQMAERLATHFNNTPHVAKVAATNPLRAVSA